MSWLDKIYGAGSIVAVTAGLVPVGAPSPYSPLRRPVIEAVSHHTKFKNSYKKP
ncbi:MAG: hypothetical protein ACP5IM_05000 [Candidatus Bathyarchaeia archaeon]